MQTLARTVGVTRRYGDVLALDDVTLDVPAGQLLGLLGPNGAGKSTLLQLLAGLRRPTSGRVELLGGDPRDAASRRHLGTTPQETGLPATLTVREAVDVVARHFADPVGTDELLDRFGLGGLQRRQTGGMSGGQRRRLAVALAFVGRPRVVLLDEPTTGLDVEARHALWAAVRDYPASGASVVLTSHYLEEVEALAERVVVIHEGRVRADGTVDEVRSEVATRRVRFSAPDVPELPGVERATRTGDRHELWTSDADALVRAVVGSGVAFRNLEVTTASLEEAFVALTASSTGPDRVPSTGPDRALTAASNRKEDQR